MRHIITFYGLLLIGSLLVLAGPVASYGQQQDPPAFYEQPVAAGPAPAEAVALPQAETVAIRGARRVYLPSVRGVPTVSIQFGSGYDQKQGKLTGVATTFGYGLKTLYYQIRVKGADRQTVLRQWLINGKPEKGLERSITVYGNDYVYTGGLCYGSFSCGASIPRGSYQLRVSLGGQVYASATARIR